MLTRLELLLRTVPNSGLIPVAGDFRCWLPSKLPEKSLSFGPPSREFPLSLCERVQPRPSGEVVLADAASRWRAVGPTGGSTGRGDPTDPSAAAQRVRVLVNTSECVCVCACSFEGALFSLLLRKTKRRPASFDGSPCVETNLYQCQTGPTFAYLPFWFPSFFRFSQQNVDTCRMRLARLCFLKWQT